MNFDPSKLSLSPAASKSSSPLNESLELGGLLGPGLGEGVVEGLGDATAVLAEAAASAGERVG